MDRTNLTLQVDTNSFADIAALKAFVDVKFQLLAGARVSPPTTPNPQAAYYAESAYCAELAAQFSGPRAGPGGAPISSGLHQSGGERADLSLAPAGAPAQPDDDPNTANPAASGDEDDGKRRRRSKVELAADKYGVTVEEIHAAAGGKCAPAEAEEVAARLQAEKHDQAHADAAEAEAIGAPAQVQASLDAAAAGFSPPHVDENPYTPENYAPAAAPAPTPTADAKPATIGDVTRVIQAIADKWTVNHALALLAQYGAKSRKTLPEEHYGAFVSRGDAALASGEWPADLKVEG